MGRLQLLGLVTQLFGVLLLLSCWRGAPKEMLLSLATGETTGTPLNEVLSKFGKPEYAVATPALSVIAWYRVTDKACSRYGGFLRACHVSLWFSPRQGCDDDLDCYRLERIEFPVSVERQSKCWIRERRQDWYEYSNPPNGPHTTKEFSRGESMRFRTDWPEPSPKFQSALGIKLDYDDCGSPPFPPGVG
jgi:hypothetical protein